MARAGGSIPISPTPGSSPTAAWRAPDCLDRTCSPAVPASATASRATPCTGLQLIANWKSRSRITAGSTEAPNDIIFDPFLRLDLNAFTNLGMAFPDAPALKGLRLALGVENLFDAMQHVHDQGGATPLRYQPYLLNALGRTVSLSLRKTF
jgi:iron complex outermembrane receptor protein